LKLQSGFPAVFPISVRAAVQTSSIMNHGG
jgi:hypothetical protein